MAVESGKDGKILIGATPIAHITNWSFDKGANVSQWASSSTAGFKDAVVGVKSGSGSISGKLDTTTPQTEINEGTIVTLKLYVNATKGYVVPAVIQAFRVTGVDIDNGTEISFEASFVTKLAWTDFNTIA